MFVFSKKILSVFLVIIIVLNVFSCAALAVGENEIVLNSINLITDDVSRTGFAREKWVDANGNEIEVLDGAVPKGFTASKVTSLPSEYSSKDKGYVSSVKNQEQTSVCWAFASNASAETSLLKNGYVTKSDNGANLSESHLAWFTHKSLTSDVNDPTYGDGTNIASPYYMGGYWLRSTFTLARGSGFALEKDYPYYASDVSLMSNLEEKDRYVSNFTLNSANLIENDDMDGIKQAIMKEGSVLVAVYINNAYLNQGADGCAYYQNYSAITNHEMIIVGWDDNFSVNNFDADIRPSSNGAWLVKNSYGTEYGDGGFFWISYEEPSLDQFVVQSVSPKEADEKIYQYDGYGYNTGLWLPSSGKPIQTVSQSNVFTAEKDEMINAVSFYTMQANVQYKIEIYKNVKLNSSSPISGGEKTESVTTGLLSYEGYNKIPLDKKVSLKKGESFSIVVTLSVSGDAPIYLPIEGQSGMNDGVVERYYGSKSGQSYFKFGDSAWKESSNNAQYNNVCIKAFTLQDDTVEISTIEEFNSFAKSVSDGNTYEGKNVILLNDIDFSDSAITPVGTEDNAFAGNFLGSGFVIKNGTISSDSNYLGLFAKLSSSASVTRLGVENVKVSGAQGVGSIAGFNDGEISNCYSICDVEGDSSVGGIVGVNKGVVSYSYSLSNVSGLSAVGTVVGTNINGTYEKCVAYINENIPFVGNAKPSGFTSFDMEAFENGEVAFYLDDASTSRKNIWTKRDGITTFIRTENEAVYKIELYSPADYSSRFIYCTQSDNLQLLANSLRHGYDARIFTDSRCTAPYTDKPKANIMLYVVWSSNGHTIKFYQETAPTCTENGYYSHYECDACQLKAWDEELKDVITDVSTLYILASGHTEVYDEAKIPTCTDTGLTSGSHCSVCGEIIVEQKIIDALGHEEEEIPGVEPDCTNTGLTSGLKCKVCGEIIKAQEIVKATGHTYESVKTKPTCIDRGYTTYTCRCGDEYVDDYVDAIGHTPSEWKTRLEPTCTLDGKEFCICTVCEELLEERVIPATGHEETDWIVLSQPTETQRGEKQKVCTVCNEITEQKEIPALNERFTLKGTVKTFDDGIDNSDITTVTVTKLGNTEPQYTFTFDGTGTFDISFDELEGVTYIIKISKVNHATREYIIDVDENIKMDMQINLLGDINGDGYLKMNDLSLINAHLKETKKLTGYALSCADVNLDGGVKMSDLSLVNAHIKEIRYLWK